MTLTSRTPAVTGGSQLESTTRSSSSPPAPVEVAQRTPVHGLVVVDQQLEVLDLDRVHVRGGVAVAVGRLVEGQREALGPAVVPGLRPTGDPRDVVVLHPRAVPQQPDDVIAVATGAVVGRVEVKVLDHVDMELPDPDESVGEQL